MRLPSLLCFCLLCLTPTVAQAEEPNGRLLQPAQYNGDPCRDGRVSDGRARSCGELRRWLRQQDRYGDRRQWRRKRYDPCTDGSISDGRPRSCQELRRWFNNPDLQDWD